MLKILQTQTRALAFVAAMGMALAVQGSLLLGVDHLASQADLARAEATVHSTVATHQEAQHVAL